MKTIMHVIQRTPAILIILCFFVFSSCRETSKKEETATETTSDAMPEGSEVKNSDSNGDVALNPAHGQPGHRCDIPVGAPLNSAAGNNTNTMQNGTPLMNSGDVKLNPPHGQPGHRCDIKVGDPL